MRLVENRGIARRSVGKRNLHTVEDVGLWIGELDDDTACIVISGHALHRTGSTSHDGGGDDTLNTLAAILLGDTLKVLAVAVTEQDVPVLCRVHSLGQHGDDVRLNVSTALEHSLADRQVSTEALNHCLVLFHADVRLAQAAVLSCIACIAVHALNLGVGEVGESRVTGQRSQHVAHVQALGSVFAGNDVLLLGDENVAGVVVGHRHGVEVLEAETVKGARLASVTLHEALELLAVVHRHHLLLELAEGVDGSRTGLVSLSNGVHRLLQHLAQFLVVLNYLSELLGIVALQPLVDTLKLSFHVLGGDGAFHCLVDNIAHRTKNILHEALLLGILDIVKVVAEVRFGYFLKGHKIKILLVNVSR